MTTELPGLDFPTFEPHPWLRGPNRQTIFGALAPRGLDAFRERAESRLVRTDEATQVRVEVDRPVAGVSGKGGPRSAVVLLHGLGGSSESRYLVGTAHKAVEAGFLAVRMNARNCGGTEALTAEPYNGEETADLRAVARDLVERDGIERVHLVGVSVGGNQVLRLGVELAPDPPGWLRSIGVVSPCIDFATAADGLEIGTFQRLYQRYLVAGLKDIARARRELHDDPIPDRLHQVVTIRDFDQAVTAPLSGYGDADEYYREASIRDSLHLLRTPTLVVMAEDDPLVPFHSFAGLDLGGAPVRLLVTDHGGHVGFLARRAVEDSAWRDLDRRWAENRVIQFARACDGD